MGTNKIPELASNKLPANRYRELQRPMSTKASMRFLTFFIMLATSLAVAAERPGQTDIDYLLASVESSGCHFIRNGTDYDGKTAADHLRRKLASAGDKVQTVDEFIDGIATKSSMTGQPYQVKKTDGTV